MILEEKVKKVLEENFSNDELDKIFSEFTIETWLSILESCGK